MHWLPQRTEGLKVCPMGQALKWWLGWSKSEGPRLSKENYIIEETLHEGDGGRGGNEEGNTVAIRNQICEQTCKKYIRTNFLGLCRGRFSLDQFNLLSCSCQLSSLYLLSNSFEPSFQTHSLQIYCFRLFGPRSIHRLG